MICAHSYLSNVYVSVAHSHHAEVFLLGALTCSCKLSNRTGRSRLGGLSAGVGVNFGIEYQNVYVFAACEYVIQSAVTDVVCPTVAAEDPNGLLNYAVCAVFDCGKSGLEFAFGFGNGVIEVSVYGSLNFLGNVCVFHIFEPEFKCVAYARACAEFDSLIHKGSESCSASFVSEIHAVTKLCIVLEERVAPGGTVAVFIEGVRAGGSGAAVNGRTSGSVSNYHSVTEELSDKFYIRSFAATCASAGEFKQRLKELAALYGRRLKYLGGVDFGKGKRIIVISFVCCDSFVKRLHFESLVLGRTNVCAAAATGTVERRYLHTERISGHSVGSFYYEAFGKSGVVFYEHRSYSRMRTYERTLITLYAVFCNPSGNFCSDTALFEFGRSGRNCAGGIECGNRESVTFLRNDGKDKVSVILVVGRGFHFCAFGGSSPGLGISYLFKTCDSVIDTVEVLLNDLGTFLSVSLFDSFLHVLFCVFVGDNV